MRLELAAYPGHSGKKQHTFFIFFLSCFNPPVCLFDLCIWLKSQTHFTRAIGHQYLPMWRYWESNGYFLLWPLCFLCEWGKCLRHSQMYYFTSQFTTYRFQTSVYGVLVKNELAFVSFLFIVYLFFLSRTYCCCACQASFSRDVCAVCNDNGGRFTAPNSSKQRGPDGQKQASRFHPNVSYMSLLLNIFS